MLWTIGLRNLSPHLTEITITTEYTNAGNVSIMTPAQHWALDQQVVKQLIATSIPDTVFNEIKGTPASTAKDVWDALKRLYEGCTTLILMDLGRRLQTTHCIEEDSVRAHLELLADLHKQLAAMGHSVADAEFTSILMGSLPPSYAPTLSGIATAAKISATVPTVAVVKKLAVDEYDRHTLRASKGQDEAFAADARKKDKKCDVECFNCHEPRYWSTTDRYRATLLQGKQVQDASLWFPYKFRAGRTAGNSRGHSLVQSPECGNESNQAWESCTTSG